MFDDKTLTMSSTVVTDLVVVAPVRNPPEVAPFPFQINVPPPLLPPIAPSPSPYDSVADKEDNVVVESPKEAEGICGRNETEICSFSPMAIENNIR